MKVIIHIITILVVFGILGLVVYFDSDSDSQYKAKKYRYSVSAKILAGFVLLISPLLVFNIAHNIYGYFIGALIVLALLYFNFVVLTYKIFMKDDVIVIKNIFGETVFKKENVYNIIKSDWQPEYIVYLKDKSKVRFPFFISGINGFIAELLKEDPAPQPAPDEKVK